MSCEINVNTSISGNVITTVQSTPTLEDPIVLIGQLTITGTGTVLSDIPVSSGVRFQPMSDVNNFVIGGTGGNIASFTDSTNYVGIRYGGGVMTETFPVTNLNQLSIAGELSGKKAVYFAVTISG